ncbi:hypothetical protein AVEN_267505-1 [Araneus ventricosus]|uniref:Uncharacterized protein n=1 Tax=Araneus ventricosus TaxID=182803 RepID=A0A4Y2INF6_ARAVE|nr:hypothetical protein AVEN_267505-1 [Araneus ventricosus]
MVKGVDKAPDNTEGSFIPRIFPKTRSAGNKKNNSCRQQFTNTNRNSNSGPRLTSDKFPLRTELQRDYSKDISPFRHLRVLIAFGEGVTSHRILSKVLHISVPSRDRA